jgi:hypothetical protein
MGKEHPPTELAQLGRRCRNHAKAEAVGDLEHRYVFAPKGKVSANPRKDRHSFRSSAASTHRPGGTSSGSPKLESSSGPRKVVISAIPSPSSVSTEMLRGRKLCHSSSQR